MRVYPTGSNVVKPNWNKFDLLCIIAIIVSYYFLSVIGLSWDHLERAGGYGLDPDPQGISEALGYLYNFHENWRIGGKEYPQGYGILLALFYGTAVSAATLAGKLPAFEIQMANQPYGRLLMAVANISTAEGRIFFTLVARGMSSLFGLLTVLLVYVIGRDYFHSRKVGIAASIMLLSAYPFIIFSQYSKYPTTAYFFFLLSFYLSICLIDTPSISQYFWAGLCTGFAISIIYFNGIALIILLISHTITFQNAHAREPRLSWFNKQIGIALFATGYSFLLTNLRFLSDGPTLILDIMAWSRMFFASDNRGDAIIQKLHGGISGLHLFMRGEVGLPLLATMVVGILGNLIHYTRRKGLFLFVGFFYLALSIVGQVNYIASTGFPVLMLLSAQWCKQAVDRGTKTLSVALSRFTVSRRTLKRRDTRATYENSLVAHQTTIASLVFGAVVIAVSGPGIGRITAQNLINHTVSTKIQARQWVQGNLPSDAKYIVDGSGIQIEPIAGRVFQASFGGGARAVTHSLQDIFHASGPEVFSAEYAMTGSDFLEFISESNVRKYPALQRNLSASGVGFGLREAYEEYFELLNKNAVLLKEFPKGNWVGEDHINVRGFLFEGVPWVHYWDFLTDASTRTHGPEIKIYKLTPQFWQAMEAKLFTDKPAAVCAQSDDAGAAHNGMRLLEKSAAYNPTTKTFAIELCWQSDHSKIMNELTFSLDYASMLERDFWYYIRRGISTVLGTNQRHRQIYREYFNLQGDSYRASTTFTVPDNMAKGDYVLRYYFADDPYNELELARTTQ